MDDNDKRWVKLKIRKSTDKIRKGVSGSFVSKDLFKWTVAVGAVCLGGIARWIAYLHGFPSIF